MNRVVLFIIPHIILTCFLNVVNNQIISASSDKQLRVYNNSPLLEKGKRNSSASSNIPLAMIANDNVSVEFAPALHEGKSSAYPVIKIKKQQTWMSIAEASSSEMYEIIESSKVAPNDAKMRLKGIHPQWIKASQPDSATAIIWEAGTRYKAVIKTVTQTNANKITLEFYPIPSGTLIAIWELYPNDKTIRVSLEFTPNTEGKQYCLGYWLFCERDLADVQELLMPMLIQRKRFPKTNYTLLQAASPTPVSLMQLDTGKESIVLGVSADTIDNKFEFPQPSLSRNGLHIRNEKGLVQPSIYGPLIGSADAKAEGTIKLSFRILAQKGNWYSGYRTIADKVFGWRDYRKNGAVSLTQATYNMIDLFMDDQYGGWWSRAKAPYQVESPNTATEAAPMIAMSLYRLTGDTAIYQRRALPTLEFLISRKSPHFSPVPENSGRIGPGSMKGGPVTYGTSVFGGLWKLTNKKTQILYDIATPQKTYNVRTFVSPDNYQSHIQLFDELLARYLLLGDVTSLNMAKEAADNYIKRVIETTPTNEMDTKSFFLLQYLPNWEGLLHLYEVTNEKRYLDAAQFSAYLLMTGIWTQPTPISGDVTIHPDGYCHGDRLHFKLFKGNTRYRLGWPRKEGDTPEKKVPAWLVSNVGLGFEQPSTYTSGTNGGRMILQATWAPSFLRLARYTGDSQFEVYARNAVLGRWGNYPGYYYTTFTDLPQSAQYPYVGPDMTCMYYHHLNAHLTWVIDYLVSLAALRSNGAVTFPSQRQFGYAYFNNLVYGHAPGKIMNNTDVWLWFDKSLISVDNSQIDYLMAHTDDKFYVIFMNQSNENETTSIVFNSSKLLKGNTNFNHAKIIYPATNKVSISNNRLEINLIPKGMKILEIADLSIKVPTHHLEHMVEHSSVEKYIDITGNDGVNVKAATIQADPAFWNAFVWSEAESGSVKEMVLKWESGHLSGTITDMNYPYEFSVKLPSTRDTFTFFVTGVKEDGTTFACKPATIGINKIINNR